jgi:hypothetical protein
VVDVVIGNCSSGVTGARFRGHVGYAKT